MSKIKNQENRIPRTNQGAGLRPASDYETILKNPNYYFKGKVLLRMFGYTKYTNFVKDYCSVRGHIYTREIKEEDLKMFDDFNKGKISLKEWANLKGCSHTKINYLIGRIYVNKVHKTN